MIETPLNLSEYESLAREKLAPAAYDYYAGAAWDGVTLKENSRAFARIALRPRMLIDVSTRNKTLTLFGCRLSMPVVVAPMAFQCMAHPDGELAMAEAASSAGIPMCLSTLANFSIEDVTKSSPADIWFQLYVYKDRGITRDLIKRAERAGCKALVVTVDSPLLGRRERDVRNRFHLPPGLKIGNLAGSALDRLPEDADGSGLASYIASLYDTCLTWKDLEWFRGLTSLPILVKGILRGDDASTAIKCGANGVVVSNHGGRQLDTALASIRALPPVLEAVGNEVDVLMDGGVRRGTDILKSLALGAKAVMLGRPALWGLAVNGKAGAEHIFELIRAELDLAMALSGCPDLASVTPDLLLFPDQMPF